MRRKKKGSLKTLKILKINIAILVVMFIVLIGTTYAWFTSVSEVGTDKIQSGKLDVLLIDENGQSLDGETLKFVSDENEVLWEPGATYNIPAVFVKNNGNLSLKYYIEIVGVDGSDKLLEAIDWTINGYDVEAEHILLPNDKSEEFIISGHMREDAGNEYQNLSITGLSIKVRATQVSNENN